MVFPLLTLLIILGSHTLQTQLGVMCFVGRPLNPVIPYYYTHVVEIKYSWSRLDACFFQLGLNQQPRGKGGLVKNDPSRFVVVFNNLYPLH